MLNAQWNVALEEQSHWFILKMNLHFCDMIIYMPLSMVIRLNLKRILKSSSGFVVRTWHCKHPCSCWTVTFKFRTSLQYQPEKTATILQWHNWFPCEMSSEKCAQKFHTDEASLSRSGSCFWLVEANFPWVRPIRSTTYIWVVTRHQYGISVLIPDVIPQGNQWWHGQMSAVFSDYTISIIMPLVFNN